VIRALLPPCLLAGALAGALVLGRVPEAPAAAGVGGDLHPQGTEPPPAVAVPAPPEIELPRLDPFRAFDDRTQPRKAGATSSKVLKLSGVYRAGKRLTCVINDHNYGVGDRIGDAVVKSIELNQVVIDRNGVLETLKLNTESL
jgi:hypothetical protein